MRTLKVGQLLHGYSDGHKLIAGSIDPSAEARRTILVMSDLSGPSMVDGFDSYLTAYPVPSSDHYAIARTWYAKEMPRPGCVWTHTLLIATKDISAVSEWKQIESLFRRPDADGNWEEFRKSLAIEPSKAYGQLAQFDVNSCKSVMRALYAQPELPLVLLAKDSERYEALVLALWLAQWPELRTNFSFCTGALGARKVNGRFFDLQVSPTTALRQLKRDMPNASVLDLLIDTASDASEWLETAMDDLPSTGQSDFRIFARNAASIVPPSRANYRALAELFSIRNLAVHNQAGMEHVLAEILRRCEITGDWSIIPFVLEYPGIFHSLGSPQLTRSEVILALSRIKVPPELEALAVHIVQLLNTEGRSTPLSLAANLASETLNSFGESILIAIVDSSNPEEILQTLPNSRQLLYGMVRRRPEFATSPDLWMAAQVARGELIDAVIAAHPKPNVLRDIIRAMVAANVEPRSNRLYELEPKVVVGAILDSILSNPHLGQGWRQGLEHYPEHILHWIGEHQDAPLSSLDLAIRFINSVSQTNNATTPETWTNINQRILKGAGTTDFPALRSFLMVIAFTEGSPKLNALIQDSFLTIHEALANDRLDSRSWDLLDGHLPSVNMWWDRCERLRRGTIKVLSHTGGSLADVFHKADEDTARYLAKACLSAEGGRALLSRSLSPAQYHSLPTSVRRVLRDFEA